MKNENLEEPPCSPSTPAFDSESHPYHQPTPIEKPEAAAAKGKERKFFECADCGLNEEYNYFGKSPPFCRGIKFIEESYVVRDPFSAYSSANNANFLLLGSNCTVCCRMTCQECSVFFSKRFCARCYKVCANQLPEELLKLKKKAKD